MILRDRDANTAWESQADGTLEERVYSCQNWRADVVALMTDSGELINQVRYDPYGVPFGIAKTDLDADGDVDSDDYTQFLSYYTGGTMPYADWNWDGTKDTADITAYLNDKNADAGLGRGDPSYAYGTAGGANRKAYAGYEIEPVLTGSEGWESVYHVRNRVLLSRAGRWTRRDPLGYKDGMNIYAYTLSPLVYVDSHGLVRCPGGLCKEDIEGCPGTTIIAPGGNDDGDLCQCCDKLREEVSGLAVTWCCGGTATICVFDDRFDDEGGDDNAARSCIRDCAIQHEFIHLGEITCNTCDDITGGYEVFPCPPDGWDGKTDTDVACYECRGYQREASCLTVNLFTCCNQSSDPPKCAAAIRDRFSHVLQELKRNCLKCAGGIDSQ